MNQDELEKKWREEFSHYEIELMNGSYVNEETIYIAACKARQKEIETLKEKLDYSKMFHCPNFVTTDNGYIACNLDKHLLQKELDEAMVLLRIAKIEMDSWRNLTELDADSIFEWYDGYKQFLAKVKRG
jgi:hypothetical protein